MAISAARIQSLRRKHPHRKNLKTKGPPNHLFPPSSQFAQGYSSRKVKARNRVQVSILMTS